MSRIKPTKRVEKGAMYFRRLRRRMDWLIRDVAPERWVERDIAGVRMAMPWSHRLPDFVGPDSPYGENLLELAALLSRERTIDVVDLGANIGDSTLLILDRADARVLAVEPDEVFLPYLRHNVADNPRVVVEPSLLTVGESSGDYRAKRVGGTATFVAGNGSATVPTLSVTQLRENHPEFADLRLIKADTDGHDVVLVPALVRAWDDAKPVLFFEYDHRASEAVGNDPMQIWTALVDLGYSDCAIWGNGGRSIARCTLSEARDRAEHERPSSPGRFWDVAAVADGDADGIAVLDQLIPRA